MYSRLSMVKLLYCEKKWFQAVDKGKWKYRVYAGDMNTVT